MAVAVPSMTWKTIEPPTNQMVFQNACGVARADKHGLEIGEADKRALPVGHAQEAGIGNGIGDQHRQHDQRRQHENEARRIAVHLQVPLTTDRVEYVLGKRAVPPGRSAIRNY
jgi:hypothetical protein